MCDIVYMCWMFSSNLFKSYILHVYSILQPLVHLDGITTKTVDVLSVCPILIKIDPAKLAAEHVLMEPSPPLVHFSNRSVRSN